MYWIINKSKEVLFYASLMQEKACCSFTFPIFIPGLIMQISYGPALQIIFNVKKETHERSIFEELNAPKICQINLLLVLISM